MLNIQINFISSKVVQETEQQSPFLRNLKIEERITVIQNLAISQLQNQLLTRQFLKKMNINHA